MTPDDFRDARLRLGFTQRNMAERLGVHELTVRAWESGRQRIPPMAALALAELARTAPP